MYLLYTLETIHNTARTNGFQLKNKKNKTTEARTFSIEMFSHITTYCWDPFAYAKNVRIDRYTDG